MFTCSKNRAPIRSRPGMTTRILLQAGDVDETGLTVTWVEVAPGGAQGRHSHASEQVYVIVAGRGRMQVGEEAREIAAGDLAHVPPGVPHAIVNTGDGVLSYVSAATPAFSQTGFYDAGGL